MEFEELYKEEIKKFGLQLKDLRKKRKKTQLDLEVATGINHGDISRIENGKINIEFYTMIKLATALDVSIIEFFK